MKFLQITARLFVVTALFGLVLGTTGCGDKEGEKKDGEESSAKENPSEENKGKAGETGEPGSNSEEVSENQPPKSGSTTGAENVFNDDFDF